MYSYYSILECYNLFSGVELSIRWFCFISKCFMRFSVVWIGLPLVQYLLLPFNFVIIFFRYGCLAQNESDFQKVAVMFTKLQVIVFTNCDSSRINDDFLGNLSREIRGNFCCSLSSFGLITR